jgi:hypothetical protein
MTADRTPSDLTVDALFDQMSRQCVASDWHAAIASGEEMWERFGDSADDPATQQVVRAGLFNLGTAYEQARDRRGAIRADSRLVGTFGGDESSGRMLVDSLTRLGRNQAWIGEPRAARTTADELLRRCASASDPQLQAKATNGLLEIAGQCSFAGSPDAAVLIGEQIWAQFGDSESPEIRAVVVAALHNLVIGYAQLRDVPSAVMAVDRIRTAFGDSTNPIARRMAATSLSALATAGIDAGDYATAVSSGERLCAAFAKDPDFIIREQVALVESRLPRWRMRILQPPPRSL